MISAITGFFYANSTNSQIGWPQDKKLNVDVCSKSLNLPIKGTDPGEIQYSFETLNLWKDVLNERLDIEYRHRTEFPPFSDLNSHCIYTVEDLLTEQNSEVNSNGFALNFYDETKSTVIDSDVFMVIKEINKVVNYLEKYGLSHDDYDFQKSVDETLLHEVGHLLQLGHQFTGIESIMSYDAYEEAKLYEYDVAAIQALYPIIEAPIVPPVQALDPNRPGAR